MTDEQLEDAVDAVLVANGIDAAATRAAGAAGDDRIVPLPDATPEQLAAIEAMNNRPAGAIPPPRCGM